MSRARPTEGPTIDTLLVGGSLASRAALIQRLEVHHCTTRIAVTVSHALRSCRSRTPDLVVLDGRTRDASPRVFAEALRAIPRCRRTPVLHLLPAGHAAPDDVPGDGWFVIEGTAQSARLGPALARALPHRRGWRKRAPQGARTRVLIVDDSALAREVLTRVLSMDPALEVVGAARDAEQAWRLIQSKDPDVLTLDVEMPGMDGLTFLGRLMELRPLPVVMVSSHTGEGSSATLRALELGAVDFVLKPRVALREGTHDLAASLLAKVRGAALARRVAPTRPSNRAPRASLAGAPTGVDLLGLGASTGGPMALARIFAGLPAGMPPIVITQHMPPTFTRSFAKRLHDASALDVAEAHDGAVLARGTAWVAPGDAHVLVEAAGNDLVLRLDQGPPVNHHRPSVDVMFESMAKLVDVRMGAVLMTGMGADGAQGLLAIRGRGGVTLAQDEATSVVYGMPRAAQQLGAADRILPLEAIGPSLVDLATSRERTRTRRRRLG